MLDQSELEIVHDILFAWSDLNITYRNNSVILRQTSGYCNILVK